MRTSASVPSVRVRGPPPSSFLPQIVEGDAVKRGLALAKQQRVVGLTASGRMKLDALADIERFLDEELGQLDPASDLPPEVVLQPHREALNKFISSFSTYAGPLSAIQHAYEAQIEAMRTTLRNKTREQEAQNAEFELIHQRITDSLKSQLDEANTALANACVPLSSSHAHSRLTPTPHLDCTHPRPRARPYTA